MNDIKVSVIIPVYNNEDIVAISLLSLLKQDFREKYEIIVVDDGSTDNSLNIAKSILKDGNTPYKIIHQKHAGVSIARNNGINASRGDYLLFVDSDDYVLSNHLSELYNGRTDFTLTKMAVEGSKIDTSLYPEKAVPAYDVIKMELKMKFPKFSFCQLIYRADIIKNNDIFFDSKTVYGEDTEFALKALSYGDSVAFSNEITYFYIQHENSSTAKAGFKRFDFIKTLENLGNFYKSKGYDELADLITTYRIPKAVFGNMNYFFYNNYDFDEVISKMEELDLFTKLSKFKGEFKFKLKIKLFLLNPKAYYKMWKKLKNTI